MIAILYRRNAYECGEVKIIKCKCTKFASIHVTVATVHSRGSIKDSQHAVSYPMLVT